MNYLVIDLFDVTSYLNARKIDYITQGKDVTTNWIGIRCPYCDDTGHHLGVNLSSNFISCWRCGAKGSVVKLVQLFDRISFQEALDVLEEYPRPFYQQTVDSSEQIPKRKFHLPNKFSLIQSMNIPSQVKHFIRSRGFDPETLVSQKELYFADHNSYFYCNRLVIPIFMNRKMVSFVARDVTGRARQPYLNCSIKQSSTAVKETLYGFDEATPGSCIVVVEGILDQWKLGVGAVATYGTQWTAAQVELLKSLKPSKVFILFDNEPEAQRSALRLARTIWFSDVEVLTLEGRKDPGELSLKEGEEVMKEWAKL